MSDDKKEASTTSTSSSTSKLHSHQVLREDLLELQNFFALSQDIFCVAGLDGKFKRVNPACTAVLGYSEEELHGRDFLSLVIPSDAIRVQAVLDEMKVNLKPVKNLISRWISKDGSLKYLSWSATPFVSKKWGQVMYASAINMTTQKNLENEVQRERAKSVAASKMAAIGEMLGNLAHEINNPLAVIEGRAALLDEAASSGRIDTEKLQKSVQDIQKMTDRISKIIRGLRSFSRDSSEDAPTKEKLRFIVDDALSLCSFKLKNKNISLQFQANAISDDVVTCCRPAQIVQVLVNLMNNACDALQEVAEDSKSRWIAIDFLESEKEVEIGISNNGPKIPTELVSKIMTPFFTTKKIGRGTGLGLSISKSIVEDHGGKLFLDLNSPQTRFVIVLPKAGIQTPQPSKLNSK